MEHQCSLARERRHRATMRRIVQRELMMALRREGAARRALAPQWDDQMLEFLVTKGFTPAYGARPLQRAIARHVLLPLAREIAARPQLDGTPLMLQVRDGQVVVAAPEPTVAEGLQAEKATALEPTG